MYKSSKVEEYLSKIYISPIDQKLLNATMIEFPFTFCCGKLYPHIMGYNLLNAF